MLDISLPTRFGASIAEEYLGRPYNLYPWIEDTEQRVVNAIMQPGRRIIIINVPPQNGKTTFCGLFLPAWFLGMFPKKQVIFVA
jgi:hypothetical protein